MRLVTWNCCRGPYSKIKHLESLAPDIAVVQECPKPKEENEQCLWFGDNKRQGILILAYGKYRLQPHPILPEVPPYTIPIQVRGPNEFILLAVWAKRNSGYPYVEAVYRAVDLYRHLSPFVLLGDFNSNAIWDAEHPVDSCHSGLVRLLTNLGMVSSYHSFHQEEQGKEKQPTIYFQWNKEKPYHIDYCFIPRTWVPQLQGVELGSYEDWKERSDHLPLLVDIREPLDKNIKRLLMNFSPLQVIKLLNEGTEIPCLKCATNLKAKKLLIVCPKCDLVYAHAHVK